MIALSGAERTGKSTLAKAYAEKHDITYIPSRAGDVFRSMDLPVGKLEPETRLLVQERILEAHVSDIRQTGGKWVSDRSALDMAAYTMIDLHDSGIDAQRVADYVERCISVVNQYVGVIVIVQPGIPYVEEDGKYARCEVRQNMMNHILRGMAADARVTSPVYVLKNTLLEISDRLLTLDAMMGVITASIIEARGAEAIH